MPLSNTTSSTNTSFVTSWDPSQLLQHNKAFNIPSLRALRLSVLQLKKPALKEHYIVAGIVRKSNRYVWILVSISIPSAEPVVDYCPANEAIISCLVVEVGGTVMVRTSRDS